MEQKTTTCPACGAPLSYTEDQETLRCGYCDADLKIVREDGEETFQVIAQPEPQKEVLSHPVIPPEPVVSAEAPEAFTPSFFTEPQRSEPFAPQQPVPAPPDFTAAADTGAQIYPPVQPVATRGGTPTWVWIVLGVVGVLCLVCACLAVAAVFLFSYSGNGTF